MTKTKVRRLAIVALCAAGAGLGLAQAQDAPTMPANPSGV